MTKESKRAEFMKLARSVRGMVPTSGLATADPAPCRVLVADPPWSFGDRLPGKKRGAAKHYGVLPAEALCGYPLPPLADDAVLFLWRVSSQVEEAYAVCRAWGFEPKSEVVWVKLNESGTGTAIGMGHIVRGAHETCIVAARGRPRPDSRGERTVIYAPRGRHSAKPDEFFHLVERLFPLGALGEHVELFCRVPRAGWLCSGDAL